MRKHTQGRVDGFWKLVDAMGARPLVEARMRDVWAKSPSAKREREAEALRRVYASS